MQDLPEREEGRVGYEGVEDLSGLVRGDDFWRRMDVRLYPLAP